MFGAYLPIFAETEVQAHAKTVRQLWDFVASRMRSKNP